MAGAGFPPHGAVCRSLCVPSPRAGIRASRSAKITVDSALMPQRPCGVTTNPLSFSVRAFDLVSPVLLENSAKFKRSSSNESPASRAISSMALSIISRRPLRSLPFVALLIMLVYWRIPV